MSGVNSKFHPVEGAGTSQNGAVSAVASTSQILPCIFKMNVDSFEDLFEFLSLDDLITLRVTCKRMKQIIDYFIRMNFPRALRKICITRRNEEQMDYFGGIEMKGFELVNHIQFFAIGFTRARIVGIRPILGQAETVGVVNCTFDKLDFYDDFLKYCTRLKSLYVVGRDIQYKGKWLHQRYPTLEHIVGTSAVEWAHLEILFKNNPNIQHLNVDPSTIWKNRNSIRKSSIKFGRLDITWNIDEDENDQVCDLLNELHEQGFFQRLYARSRFKIEGDFRRITSLAGLEGLFGYQPEKGISPGLSNLKKLGLESFDGVCVSEVLTLASNLPNLQRIVIEFSKFGHILPFIQKCPKLTQIQINNLQNDDNIHPKNDIINLPEINKEREKLSNARKVTIFVDENIFLANKWKQNINFNLIELKRMNSWEESNFI